MPRDFPIKFTCLLTISSLFLWTGCTRYQGSDQTEKDHPKLVEARERVRVQDLDGAEELLLKFLHDKPDFALTHLQLGMLYQSKIEPVKSLYHFERYLEARPDSEKTKYIEQVVADERRRLAAAFAPGAGEVEPGSPEERIEALSRKLSDTEQKLAVAEVHLQQLRRRQSGDAAEAPDDWAREKLALLEEIRRLRAGETSSPGPEVSAVESSVKTYTVASGDTLGRISRKMYGEASQWRRIYEANRGKIPNQNALRVGTVLVIPDE